MVIENDVIIEEMMGEISETVALEVRVPNRILVVDSYYGSLELARNLDVAGWLYWRVRPINHLGSSVPSQGQGHHCRKASSEENGHG